MTFFQTLSLSVFSLTSAFYFFYFGAVGVYIIFLPKLLIDAGYAPFEIGVLFSVGPVMRFLVPFLFVKYIDLTPSVFRFALIASLAMTLLFILFYRDFYLALISLALMGAFWSLVLPFVETLALEKIGSRYGNARLFGSVGFIITGLLLGHIALGFGIAMSFYVATIIATLITGFLLSQKIEKTPAKISGKFSFKAHMGFWIAIFFMQVSFGGFYNFFTIYAREHEIALSTISYLWSIGVLAEIVMFIWQRRVLHLPLISLLNISLIVTAIRWFLLFLFPDQLSIYLLSQVLHAFSLALFHTVAISYIQANYKNAKLGQQFYLGIGYGLGAFVGSVISGVVYGKYLFLYMALFSLLGAFALLKKR